MNVPKGTDISVVQREYSDLWLDGDWDDQTQYFIGKSSEEDDPDDPDGPISESFLTRDEAIEFCGFVEGAIPSAVTLIEGNGGWAQGMLSTKDFSGYASKKATKAEWKRESNLWWAAHKRGQDAVNAQTVPTEEGGEKL